MRLGRYELQRQLAVGGMAELFLTRVTATQGFEKLVALKRILPSFAQNPEFTEMFLSEARLAAGLDHPNIAQVFDFGEHEGTYFFTMEYIRGRNLREIVGAVRKQERSMPLGFVLHIVTGMLAGLHHAHEQRDAQGRPQGIVHRDVSPPNVLLSYDGDVKVVDFGIAKAYAVGPGTVTGSIKGKLAYMSPEQCRAEPLDRRSDLFSIGTLLWELTMRRRLFGKNTGANHLTLLKTVEAAQVPRPTELQREYPAWLEPIVLKALARDPNDRYATALEFRMALEAGARQLRLAVSSAQAACFMAELFPVEERDTPGLIEENTGTVPSPQRRRQSSATQTDPGEGTQRERRASLPYSVVPPSTAPQAEPKGRSNVPVMVAGVGLVAALSVTGTLVFSGATQTESATESLRAPAVAPATPARATPPKAPTAGLESARPPAAVRAPTPPSESPPAPAADADTERAQDNPPHAADDSPLEPKPKPRSKPSRRTKSAPSGRPAEPASADPEPEPPATAPKQAPEPPSIFMKPHRDRAPGGGAPVQ